MIWYYILRLQRIWTASEHPVPDLPKLGAIAKPRTIQCRGQLLETDRDKERLKRGMPCSLPRMSHIIFPQHWYGGMRTTWWGGEMDSGKPNCQESFDNWHSTVEDIYIGKWRVDERVTAWADVTYWWYMGQLAINKPHCLQIKLPSWRSPRLTMVRAV